MSLLPAARDDRRRARPAARARRIRRPTPPAAPDDRIAVSRLGRLPESGILAAGIRMLGTVPAGGRVYLVPSLHLLAAPMRPVRCVPSAQRARQASLLATLRHEYARQGLCVVIVYRRGAVDNCSAAPGTVAALLHGPGAPAFGVVPDGIDSVTVSFRGPHHPARLAFVRRELLAVCGRPAVRRRRPAAWTGWRAIRRCCARSAAVRRTPRSAVPTGGSGSGRGLGPGQNPVSPQVRRLKRGSGSVTALDPLRIREPDWSDPDLTRVPRSLSRVAATYGVLQAIAGGRWRVIDRPISL